VTVGVALGVTALVGEAEGFGAIGFLAFTICQVNFLPFLTHLKCVLTDFVSEPTLEQVDPGFTPP
jgi:hypothetical protein